MKRLIFVLSSIFYTLPVHAIGFWGSATGGFLKGKYNYVCFTPHCTSDITAFGGFGGGIFVDYSTVKNMINLGVRLGLAFSLGVLE